MKRSVRFLLYALVLAGGGIFILLSGKAAHIWGIIAIIAAIGYIFLAIKYRKKQ